MSVTAASVSSVNGYLSLSALRTVTLIPSAEGNDLSVLIFLFLLSALYLIFWPIPCFSLFYFSCPFSKKYILCLNHLLFFLVYVTLTTLFGYFTKVNICYRFS